MRRTTLLTGLACSSLVLLGSSALRTPASPHTSGDWLNAIRNMVRSDRLETTIEKLVSFGTRHTMSEIDSETRGIGAARRWLVSELEAIAAESGRGDITVELMRHAQPPAPRIAEEVEIGNPVMIIPGLMPEATNRMYVVLGHYDSRASGTNDAESDAPGANDDGSGTALTLELARVFSKLECEATVVFLMTAGEEQGLFGAHWFARTAVDRGWNIAGALSNDIVGDPTGPNDRFERDRVRVFSEGIPRNAGAEELSRIRMLGAENDSTSRQLARYIEEVAIKHDLPVKPWLIFRTDRFLRGGDHTAFSEQGFAAVRFSEVDEHYDRQHQDVTIRDGEAYGDVAEYVDAEYLADVARLNGVALYSLANAPSIPANARLIAAGLVPDTTIRWSAAPEPDVAGYEVVYRDTTSGRWDHVVDVGNVTEITLDLSKDNWLFGVRSYDKDGFRSPVAFCGVGRR